jgi:hypothetical protein
MQVETRAEKAWKSGVRTAARLLQTEINREAAEYHGTAESRFERVAETKQGKQKHNKGQESNGGKW